MSATRHQNLHRWQQEEDANNSMAGEADLAKLSIQKFIWWQTVRKKCVTLMLSEVMETESAPCGHLGCECINLQKKCELPQLRKDQRMPQPQRSMVLALPLSLPLSPLYPSFPCPAPFPLPSYFILSLYLPFSVK